MRESPLTRTRPMVLMVTAGLLAVVGVVLVAVEPVHGAVLIVLTPQHGFDSGDLVAAPFLVLSALVALAPTSPAVIAWDDRARARPERRRLTALALAPIGFAFVTLGVLDVVWAAVHPHATTELVVSLVTVTLAGGVALFLASRSVVGRDRLLVLGAVVAFVVGSVLDTIAAPKGTVLGPTALALFLLASTHGRGRRILWAGLLAVSVVDLLALWSIHESDTVLAARGAGWTRTIALGVVLMLYAVARFAWPRRRVDTPDLLHAA